MKPFYVIVPGAGGLPKLELATPDGARAEIYLHGAHVTSWAPAGGSEHLYLSHRSAYLASKQIRGGIPVVFPQFAALGPLPMHGLAHSMPWEFSSAQIQQEQAIATFHLRDTTESWSLWPHNFLGELAVSIGGEQIEVTLGVTNTGAEPFDFTAALHSYLAVSEVAGTCVRGLGGLRYLDAADGRIIKHDDHPQVDFAGEVDRVYFGSPEKVELMEPEQKLAIRKAGFTDTVVWNPAAEKCAVEADMQPEDYRRFVCVEAAIVGVPVHLAPGEHWEGSQALIAS